MKEWVGKRVLWTYTDKKKKYYDVHGGTIKEVSPSGGYFRIELTDRPAVLESGFQITEKIWLRKDSIQILEVLE